MNENFIYFIFVSFLKPLVVAPYIVKINFSEIKIYYQAVKLINGTASTVLLFAFILKSLKGD